jgi:aminoglycoside phosphotransferase (APT) family kinase protein
MEYLPGRLFKGPSLTELAKEERGGFYSALCSVLAAIHSVDIAKVGLEDYGKKGNMLSV